jgi:O-antigen ligase
MTLPKNFNIGLLVFLFFFNRVGLPFGISFDMLLAPFLLYFIFKENAQSLLYKAVGVLLVFGVIHLVSGVYFTAFVVSNLVFIILVIAVVAFYQRTKHIDFFDEIILRITQLNSVLTILALFLLFFLKSTYLWYLVPYTSNAEALPRLKLFTEEASHYSFLLLPIFYYWLYQWLVQFNWRTFGYLTTIIISLILSFSLGVLSVIALTLFILILIYSRSILQHSRYRRLLFIGLISIVSIAGFLYYFFPINTLTIRMNNLINGLDTSGRGRTYESFEIAWRVLQLNYPLTGIGLGQFKFIGRDVLLHYYKYHTIPSVVRLPNALAETLVSFGVLGVFIRVFIQIYWAFKRRIVNNLFQTSLFISLFIYQFTGGFLMHSFEYYYWILVVVPIFKTFDKQQIFK